MLDYFSHIPEAQLANHSLVLSTLYYRYRPEEVQDAPSLYAAYTNGILKHYYTQDAE
jgi:hypothetical protein